MGSGRMKRATFVIAVLLLALVRPAQANFIESWNSGFNKGGVIPDGDLSGWSDTNNRRTTNAPRPLRSGAFTMQQSRQPPLNPQAGTPAATIGMRPATALRTKTKLVN